MFNNNIIAAPQVEDVEDFYELWRQDYAGSMSDFYTFMTTPSVERNIYLTKWAAKTEFNGSVCSETLRLG